MDGDGDTDFFASMQNTQAPFPPFDQEIVWFERTVTGYERHLIASGSGATAPRLLGFDADGDEDVDLVVSDVSEETVLWYENKGAQFSTSHLLDPLFLPLRFHAVDLDSDGDEDLVAFSGLSSDPELRLYENLGEGNFSAHSLGSFPGHGGDRIAIADYSADGRPDIAFPGPILWLENQGGQPPTFEQHEVAAGELTFSLAAGDVDLDGRIDLLGTGAFDNFDWHENRIGLRLSAGGLDVRGFLCRNRSTGQTIRVATVDPEVDCENEGLTVEPGDEIEVFVRGEAQ